jgi:CRISPR-associated endoribonuclease Cas6
MLCYNTITTMMRGFDKEMQIILTMQCENGLRVPFNYNHQLQSAIYSKLAEVGASESVHDGGYRSAHRYKAFVFGALDGTHTAQDRQFVFGGEVRLEIRSPFFDFCDSIQRSAELSPLIKLFDTTLEIKDVSVTNRHFQGGEVRFRAHSPVCVYRTEPDGSTTYFAPDSPEYIKYLLLNYRNKYAAVIGGDAPELTVVPFPRQRKIVTRFKNTWINGWKGDYTISGSGQALEFIYNTGLGAKNSQGFGLLNATE